MNHNPAIMLGLLICAATAGASELTVLGLPLGGKLEPTPKACRSHNPEQHLCWVSKPFTASNGAQRGMVRLPTTDTLPIWAAHATFNLAIARNGELESIRAHTHSADEWPRIAESITARFGEPATTYKTTANWHHPEINITLHCSLSSGCSVEFESAAAYAERQRQIAERQKKDAARPLAP